MQVNIDVVDRAFDTLVHGTANKTQNKQGNWRNTTHSCIIVITVKQQV